MLTEVLVGVSRLNDGDPSIIRAGTSGEMLGSQVGAKHAYQTMRMNSYVWRTTTAASIAGVGANNPTLFNPLGSGVITVLTKLSMQIGADGTWVISGLQYAGAVNMGAQIGTASPIVTGTPVAGVSTNLNSKRVPQTQWFPAAITFTAAFLPTVLAPVGFNLGATNGETPFTATDDIDGRICIMPGGCVQLCASTATSTTFNVAFWGYEVVLPQLA